MRIYLVTREEICTYSVKENVTCYHLNAMLLKTPMRMHFIITHHIINVIIYASMVSYSMHIGSSEGITLLEFEEELEEEQEAP